MKISWFCPPQGIDYFNVWISAPGLADMIGDSLSANQAQPLVNKVPPGNSRQLSFKLFKTRSIGSTFGNGAEFFVEANIETGKKYWVHISAVAKDGVDGRESNFQSFTWNQPAVPGLQVGTAVPWPARALPAVNEPFNTGIFAYHITNCINRVGIRIGDTIVTNIFSAANALLTNCGPNVGSYQFYTSTTRDPVGYLYTNVSSGKSILPVVLYRMQVPNSIYPTVSSNVVQASPMVENIAFGQLPKEPSKQRYSDAAFIVDPFIAVIPDQADENLFTDLPPPDGRCGIYLLDTTPLLAGAAYQYFLLRFGSDGEMEQVIPTNTIDLEVTP